RTTRIAGVRDSYSKGSCARGDCAAGPRHCDEALGVVDGRREFEKGRENRDITANGQEQQFHSPADRIQCLRMKPRIEILAGIAGSGKTTELLSIYRDALRTDRARFCPGRALWLAPTRRARADIRGRLLDDSLP